MCSCKRSIAAAATAAAVCVAKLLLMQLLLLAADVRFGVPDGQICWCGSLNLIQAFLFLSPKHDIFLVHPLAVQSHSWPRFAKRYLREYTDPRQASACRCQGCLERYSIICPARCHTFIAIHRARI